MGRLYGLVDDEPASPYHLQESQQEEEEQQQQSNASEGLDEEYEMSLTELLYSSSSYHAIVKPITLTMTLAGISVIFINNEDTIQHGEEAFADAYLIFDTDSASGEAQKLGMSLANTLIMVSVWGAMILFIVLLYKFRCMKCLIGYMMMIYVNWWRLCGGNLWYTAIEIYRLPVDKFTFTMAVYNFCLVGILSIFWAHGVPTYITQGYLICTSVILAWQLAHFDDWTAWCLLFMLAIYNLCAVLTPCGPLKALDHLMSQEDSPDLPGLLYEAELVPLEAQRVPRARSNVVIPPNRNTTPMQASTPNPVCVPDAIEDCRSILTPDEPDDISVPAMVDAPTIELPLTIAHVYTFETRGKVLAKVVDDDNDCEAAKRGNTIRLGLGGFIFFSILVAKAAQYSFATFAACMLVILAGLGGTLVLLSDYHHALPALPISMFMGIITYVITRLLVEPWIEAIMKIPYYV